MSKKETKVPFYFGRCCSYCDEERKMERILKCKHANPMDALCVECLRGHLPHKASGDINGN